ncbi:anoctamin-8-like isoform X2 [Ostrea edulis]|uniref:anoctamin-8-like isoform X2 n=1 Tax=Ostrea edulis TaxID=37623 RepID=UPI0024AFE53A|nr:anoctamin-8-like isoform X2 [Ostrea edulis]
METNSESASRLFGKKLIPTSRLVASSHILRNTIPTQDCDVLVTFPADTETSTLMWLLDRLRARCPHLIIQVHHHSNTKGSMFHLTATYEGLLKGAEELGIQKVLKEELGGGMKEFTYEEQECFRNIEDGNLFFNSQERQSIIHHLLDNLRAIQGEQLGKVKFVEGQSIVPLLESKKIISQVFPLHCKKSIEELRKTWVQAFFSSQPLDKIKDYFGVKIALYFAYLGHYTLALCLPAFVGLGIWIMQWQADQEWDDELFIAFALFNAFWATLYLELWKRRSCKLAYQWATLDSQKEMLEDPRPLYTGKLEVSPVTDRLEPFYPSWKRNLFRYLVSYPVIAVCLLVVFVIMLLIFEVQEWINSLVKSGGVPGFFSFLPKILLAVSIGILDEIYKTIAKWLNDMENYRMEETYWNHLIVKLVLFQFVNSFLSLFYIAFYLQDMDRLCDQLAAILITRQIIGNLKEAFLPYFQWKAKLYKIGYEMTKDLIPDGKAVSDHSPASSNPDASLSNVNNPETSSNPDSSLSAMNNPETSSNPDSSLSHVNNPETSSNLDSSLSHVNNPETSSNPDSLHSDVNAQDFCTPDQRPAKVCDFMKEDFVESVQNSFGVKQRRTNREGNSGDDVKSDVQSKPMTALSFTQAEVESAMKQYDDTLDDYLEMFIQFGYVTLFSSAFPLAALCALLNNVVEIRSDAFKLCMTYQRPFGKTVENIGAWQDALELMGVFAIIVNCALTGVSGQVQRMVPGASTETVILIIVLLEHIILGLKFLIAYAIPDIPETIETNRAKLEFLRREALKKFEAQMQSIAPSSPAEIREKILARQKSRRENLHQNEAKQETTGNSINSTEKNGSSDKGAGV